MGCRLADAYAKRRQSSIFHKDGLPVWLFRGWGRYDSRALKDKSGDLVACNNSIEAAICGVFMNLADCSAYCIASGKAYNQSTGTGPIQHEVTLSRTKVTIFFKQKQKIKKGF